MDYDRSTGQADERLHRELIARILLGFLVPANGLHTVYFLIGFPAICAGKHHELFFCFQPVFERELYQIGQSDPR